MKFQTYFHASELEYTGPELSPHFILSRFKKEGSCLAAFIGPCHVVTDHLVDWEDRLQNDHIKAKRMIHFLGEFFGITLREGVWIQRLIVSQIMSELVSQGLKARRDGDDIFVEHAGAQKKLSVSIVTASAVSVLLHLGINIDSTGAPVSAVGLEDFLIDPKALVEKVLAWFETEFESVERATVKVRPV
jgi:hypothetical protein